jgi:hypothetical protein
MVFADNLADTEQKADDGNLRRGLSSVFCLLSSVFCLLASGFWLLASVFSKQMPKTGGLILTSVFWLPAPV